MKKQKFDKKWRTQALSKKDTTEQNNQSNKLQEFAFCIGNVSSTIDFEQFGDLKNLIILNNLKEKLVNSWLLGSFYLNHFQDEGSPLPAFPM